MPAASLFSRRCPIIGCVHLPPLPGAPLYDGDIERVYETAFAEAKILAGAGIDGLIVENFHDTPFYPDSVPAETVAALSVIARQIAKAFNIPLGVNVLRNDAHAAVAIAVAAGAAFVRINIHMGAVVSEQGLILGKSHETLRLRAALKSRALIFADIGVKHAAPLVDRGLATDAIDAQQRGLADALIVSGTRTGQATDPGAIEAVKSASSLPVYIGSGITADNLPDYAGKIDGAIVGSYFKQDGKAANPVDPARVAALMAAARKLA
ncbi:MAG: BtpA/SgcQ family protein [Alphaproteobacteria bacterium]